MSLDPTFEMPRGSMFRRHRLSKRCNYNYSNPPVTKFGRGYFHGQIVSGLSLTDFDYPVLDDASFTLTSLGSKRKILLIRSLWRNV